MVCPPHSEDEEFKSKSQIKREMQALRDLGKALLKCRDTELSKISLSEPVREAIRQGRTFKRQALKRQIGYIGALLREIDADRIRTELEQLNRPNAEATRTLHQIENWRDQLIIGDEVLENRLVESFQADRQKLRQLVRNARKEQQQDCSPKYTRQLFALLRDLYDQYHQPGTDKAAD